jgi:hypothetical protein
MKFSIALGLFAATVMGISGCGSSTTPPPKVEAPADAVPVEIAGEEMTVELGCGGCIYEMEGVTACVTAAKVGETTMLVEGGGVDAHSAGLCEAARMATVVGEVKDGKLYASSITLN